MAPKKTTTKKDKMPKELNPDTGKKFTNFCATVNNYTDECVENMKKFISEYCSYGVFGYEVGESGTPHLQIYCELKGRMALSNIRKNTTAKIANVEPRYSDYPKESAGYCKKGPTRDCDKPDVGWILYFDNPHADFKGYEFGKENIASPGTRTDIAAASKVIQNGEKTVRELRNENPNIFHQYGRTLQELENDRHRKKFRCGEMTQCTWIHGLEGRGKSHEAFVTQLESMGGYDPDKVYDWDLTQEFQCGYEGQEVVIINEYKGPHEIKYGMLLKLIDKWPLKIKRKNPLAAIDFISKKIIITSIFHPKDVQWNLRAEDNLDQLLTRIEIKELVGDNRRLGQESPPVRPGGL